MVDLLFAISTILNFANLIAASDQQCRAAHILKDCGATGLSRAQAIAELKSVREQMIFRARQSICLNGAICFNAKLF